MGLELLTSRYLAKGKKELGEGSYNMYPEWAESQCRLVAEAIFLSIESDFAWRYGTIVSRVRSHNQLAWHWHWHWHSRTIIYRASVS
jgi:hypothetical protein